MSKPTTVFALLLASFGIACSTDVPTETQPSECLEVSETTPTGEAKPLASLQFNNAFDPTDMATYDPNDAANLPGPLMVDTWGDRSSGAHGTVGVFPPGFSAPSHTHSNDYYGVVLKGQMTNPFGTDLDVMLDADDTNNHGATVLGPGSHWYVPAGSQHTTTCMGPEVCWFYFHSEKAFDFAPIVDDMGALQAGVMLESPDGSAVLLPKADLAFGGEPGSFVQFASAWGDMSAGAHGTFGLFDAGADSPTHVHSADYYGVVVSGEVTNPFDGEESPPVLDAGSYWSVPKDSNHVTSCSAASDCLFYFHSRAGFDFTPTCE